MEESSLKSLICAVARDGLSELAPEELASFRATSDAFFRDPAKLLDKRASRDSMLGFGAGELIDMLSGPALVLATMAVSFAQSAGIQLLKDVSKASSAEMAKALVKALPSFGSRQPERTGEAKPRITTEQLREIRPLLVEAGMSLELSEAKATRLADAMICKLLERLG